ncbi:cohesin domain-containing protein [Methylomonas sp. AM2-LC]|uniref:cohesin domain-containing protein n=1 Tax=Methylomonas sp. AM2-LC TaxID=3153301 RepID=UPI003263BA17
MNIKYLALSIFLSGSMNIAYATPILSIDPTTQSVAQGSQVSFNIDISGLGSGLTLGTYDLSLSFNSTLLAYSSIQFGTGLNLFGLGDIQSVTPGAGNVEVFELSLDSAGALNVFQQHQFTLATLTFDTLGKGTSPVSLSLKALGDAYGNSLTVAIQNSSISVVPELPTFELLIPGLIGIYFVGQRKRYYQ